ncbi:MAG: type I 3-dehydroquinate dehydratase, partial [Planctomycetota bacterium]
LIEWRIDGLAYSAAIGTLVERSALPSVVTCRTADEGGGFEGSGEELVARLMAAIAGSRKPLAIDVELARVKADAALAALLPALSEGCERGLIFSTHDFTARPADLTRQLADMAGHPLCAIMKAAWRARSLRDNLEAFELTADYSGAKPLCALCMGEFGLPSRVLARKFGGWMTFAALDSGVASAPGQPTLDELKRLYRWDTLTPDTAVLGVVGYPIGHSMSPPIHNAGLDALAEQGDPVDAVYLPMPIAPEYEPFKATIAAFLDMPSLRFRGCSVTIPHKANLLRFVAERGGDVDPLSDTIGAANTLVVEPGDTPGEPKLRAFNTDYAAALDAVCDAMGVDRSGMAGKRVGVVGAGGASSAIVAAFAAHDATVVVYNRTVERAQALVDRFNGQTGKVVAAPLDKLCDTCCDVLINATPIGMHPKTDATPAPGLFTPDTPQQNPRVVFDTIYNPATTVLLAEADAAGRATISGIEMFVRQAAGQFTAWTGKPAPLDVFEQVVRDRLAT